MPHLLSRSLMASPFGGGRVGESGEALKSIGIRGRGASGEPESSKLSP